MGNALPPARPEANTLSMELRQTRHHKPAKDDQQSERPGLMASLNYIKDSPLFSSEKPYETFPGLVSSKNQTNWDVEAGPPQLIRDMREEGSFSLVEHGFTYRAWPAPNIDWTNEDEIVNEYIAQTREALREELCLAHVEVFDWRVSSTFPRPSLIIKLMGLTQLRDTSSKGVMDSLSKGRMMKIRPSEVVHIGISSPLNLCEL